MKESYVTEEQDSTEKEADGVILSSQGRFKILRLESHSWSVEELVHASEVRIFLYNLLVKLRVSGGIDDEVDANGNIIQEEDVITEFM